MTAMPSIGSVFLAASLIAAPVLAGPGHAQDAPATSANPPAAAAAPAAGSGSPQLVVATVKLDGGWRASRLIGAAVYDDQNQKIGNVDDLVMTGADKVAVAVLSVGGFLGIGSKLVAVPFDKLHYDATAKDTKVTMAGATKDSLNSMPGFTYSGS